MDTWGNAVVLKSTCSIPTTSNLVLWLEGEFLIVSSVLSHVKHNNLIAGVRPTPPEIRESCGLQSAGLHRDLLWLNVGY